QHTCVTSEDARHRRGADRRPQHRAEAGQRHVDAPDLNSMKRITMDTDTFDYIVVGAGAAGATLAEGLSRRTTGSVLVLESGGPDWDPLIHIPKGFFFLYGGKKYSFYYE